MHRFSFSVAQCNSRPHARCAATGSMSENDMGSQERLKSFSAWLAQARRYLGDGKVRLQGYQGRFWLWDSKVLRAAKVNRGEVIHRWVASLTTGTHLPPVSSNGIYREFTVRLIKQDNSPECCKTANIPTAPGGKRCSCVCARSSVWSVTPCQTKVALHWLIKALESQAVRLMFPPAEFFMREKDPNSLRLTLVSHFNQLEPKLAL